MKISPRACGHCRSPARGNPCWWFIRHPSPAYSGADPPCVMDDYSDELDVRRRSDARTTIIAIAVIVIVALVLAIV